ncbi:MAG: hypothetical protein P8N44_03040 [Flavobacteriaceae bacterium]|jgi:hypothetical protein|nr:hypothetical protein [Flavobacteriaceae bacterium]
MSGKNEILEWLQSLYEAAVSSGEDKKAAKIKQKIETLKEE